jgi:pyruvate,water dikinase
VTTLSTVDERQDGAVRYVKPTIECGPDDLPIVGGKAVGLGSLLRAGQRVPASFVITSAAYFDYCSNGTPPLGSLRDEVREPLAAAYEALCQQRRTAVVAAVRSSATVEDSQDASYAGQFQTFLGVRGADDVIAKVEECWIAAADPHVRSYRSNRDGDTTDDGVAVVVQELVHARAAGVMFTQHPRTGDRSLVVIEASHGLGEAVVGGTVTPDLFEVNKITGQVHHQRLGAKGIEYRLTDDKSAVEVREVESERQQEWSISPDEISELLKVAADLETKLGRGLDIEWAIGTTGEADGEPKLFALQVRPITVDAARSDAPAIAASNPIDMVLGRLSGPSGSAVI